MKLGIGLKIFRLVGICVLFWYGCDVWKLYFGVYNWLFEVDVVKGVGCGVVIVRFIMMGCFLIFKFEK